jgi:hypothetical protein
MANPSAVPLFAVRLVLVVLAAGAVVTAVVVTAPEVRAVARHYTCPMHSEVATAGPGSCPICGMTLIELAPDRMAMARDPAAGGRDSIALTALRASAEASSLLRFSVAPARRNGVPGEVYAPAEVEPDGTVVARLYRDEIAELAGNERAELIPATAPDAPVKLRRDAAPVIASAPRDPTARVRFRAEPGAASPRPGQIGWVRLAYKTRSALVVRSESIIDAPDGRYVLVFSAQRGQITRRPVEIGKEYSGMTAIVSGLEDKEFVVMANAFSLDAERRLADTK